MPGPERLGVAEALGAPFQERPPIGHVLDVRGTAGRRAQPGGTDGDVDRLVVDHQQQRCLLIACGGAVEPRVEREQQPVRLELDVVVEVAQQRRSPAGQLDQHGRERAAAVGEAVVRRSGDVCALEDPGGAQLAQALGEQVARHPRQALPERAMAAGAAVELAHEQECPAIADRVEGARERAGAYADAAPSLSATEVIAGSGEGLVRRCTTGMGSWEEVCTLWQPGRAYEMTVRTETYPQPLRTMLAEMRGRWQVEPEGDGVRIAMTFEAQPRLGALGGLALRLSRRRFDRECQAILDHWERMLRGDRLDAAA